MVRNITLRYKQNEPADCLPCRVTFSAWCWHWLAAGSRQGFGDQRLSWSYKTSSLILGSDFLEYTFVVAVQSMVPGEHFHCSYVPAEVLLVWLFLNYKFWLFFRSGRSSVILRAVQTWRGETGRFINESKWLNWLFTYLALPYVHTVNSWYANIIKVDSISVLSTLQHQR